MEKSLFFVGNYNLSSDSKGIYSIELNEMTGEMKVISSCDKCENPSYLVVNNNILYVANEITEKAYLTAYCIEEDGSLTLFDEIVVPGAGVCYIALWENKKFISGANYTTGNIFTCSLNEDGSFDKVVESHQNSGKSINENRQEGPHMHSITPSIDGKFWLAADLGSDDIFFYQADNKTGKMELLEKLKVELGEGPRHFVFDSKSNYGYLVTELKSNIYVYKIEENKLKFIQKLSSLKNNFNTTNYAAHIELSDDDKLIYVTNRGADTMDVFKVESDGKLTAFSTSTTYGNYPRHFEISRSKKFIVIANQKSNEVICCKVNNDSTIGELIDKVAIPKPINICFKK